jgi:hypothetical protein
MVVMGMRRETRSYTVKETDKTSFAAIAASDISKRGATAAKFVVTRVVVVLMTSNPYSTRGGYLLSSGSTSGSS